MTETRKRAKKRPARKIETIDDILRRHDLTPVWVPTDQLIPYPNNPNKGGAEEAIEDSLQTVALYRAIVVQRSTNYILAGNHTWEQLRDKGAKEVPCTMLDVDDNEARRIVVGDNNIGALAQIDRLVQAELVTAIGDTHGTGFDQSDMDRMERMVQDSMAEMESIGGEDGILERIHRESLGDIDAPDFDEDEDLIPTGEDGDDGNEDPEALRDILDVSEDLSGLFTLKDDVIWPSKHPMEYPPLREDMMMEELPGLVDSWAGKLTANDERDVWWLYNYGVDSTKGMKDLSRIIMAFYCWDENFENWWVEAGRYVGRMLNSKIQYAITPNWSIFNDVPMVLNYYNLYRSRWIGRYMQEAGIKVMPDLQWIDNDPRAKAMIDQHIAYGLPRPLKFASAQCQHGTQLFKDPKARKQIVGDWVYGLNKLEVENLLVYAGPPGRELFAEIESKVETKMTYVGNRSEKMNADLKQRKAKTTM